jgi:hypothetical protein
MSRGRRWVIIGGIGVLVIIGALIAVNLVPGHAGHPAALPTAESAPSQDSAPPAVAPTLPDLVQPGMVGTFKQIPGGGIQTTAAAEWASESTAFAEGNVDPKCAQLAFGAPVNGSLRDSIDPVVFYFGLLSPSGSTKIDGAMQVFPSEEDAINFSNGINTLVGSCLHGFHDGDGTDVLAPASATDQSLPSLEWTQTIKTSTQSYSVLTVELRKGNIVSRSYCYRATGTSDSPDICTQWEHEVATALNESH